MKRVCVVLLIMVLPKWALAQWAIVEVDSVGIHKLTGQWLMDHQIVNSGDSVQRLRIHGNAAGAMRELNGPEVEPTPLYYYVEDDDQLVDASTTYFFYAGMLHGWNYGTNGRFTYTPNEYATRHLVRLSSAASNGPILELESLPVPSTSAQVITHTKTGSVIDQSKVNLVKTGRRWFGDAFGFTKSRTYVFDLLAQGSVYVKANAVARSSSATSFSVTVNGQSLSGGFQPVGTSSYANYVTESNVSGSFTLSGVQNEVVITVSYDQGSDPSAAMWLDQLVVVSDSSQGPLLVNYQETGTDTVLFPLPSSAAFAFDITDVQLPRVVQAVPNVVAPGVNGVVCPRDKPRVYVDFSAATEPRFVRWQNETALTSQTAVQNVIITHPAWLAQAQELARLHNDEGMASIAVTLQEVYDYFNGGTPDLTAIKAYMRWLKAQGAPLNYLTLMGDASYDFKNVLPDTSNYIPTFQSYNSFSLSNSFITDDYFGYLDPGEGTNWFASNLDLGIGRIPVNSVEEAQRAVDKIKQYLEDDERLGPWRQNVVLVADDADEFWETEFFYEQEGLSALIEQDRPEVNLVKIYADAFNQESKPGSQRYPDARTALFREVESGSLAVSYIGHGGEVGWATERILQLEDIQAWSNSPKLPVFTTITCEFTRFDDPTRVSAGEQLYLNPNGGAIALFSTTRSVIATASTYALNELLMTRLLHEETARLGDIIRETKNANSSGDRIKFSLVGDPALRISRPQLTLELDSVNGQAAENFQDTLKALSWVALSGSVRNNGVVQDQFNGQAWVTLYDKPQEQRTLKNDGVGESYTFESQNNAVFRGLASVRNGRWTTTFRVPLDINLSVGSAKLSMYATSNSGNATVLDAWGADKTLNIGGISEAPITDQEGPQVKLYIDDTTFVDGGITDANPTGLALLSDESGINAVGLGIGHNITMILDGTSFNVNGFYQSDLDNFTRGQVRYPFYNLSEGTHVLELRAWDVLNQWGYDSLSFVVVSSEKPLLNQLFAYPNPFVDEVSFALNHNQSGMEGTLELLLLNQQAEVLWREEWTGTLGESETRLSSLTAAELGWPAAGFYYVRVIWTRASDGKSDQIQEKLIYIR